MSYAITPTATNALATWPKPTKSPGECIETCGSSDPCDTAACPLPDAATAGQEIPVLLAASIDLLKLAIEVADSTCRSDIECECTMVNMSGKDWYDLDAPAVVFAADTPEESRRWINRAVHYLQLRGDQAPDYRTVWHPAFAHLVRFVDVPA